MSESHSMIHGVEKVGVVGLGVMGFDIAFLYAMKGFQTIAYDASKPVMDSLTDRREQTIERLKRRGRISDQEVARVQKFFIPSSDLSGLAGADLITEAVSENAKTKLAVYQALRQAGFTGILTTNTSSVTRATLLANNAYHRDRFALTHFFNPVLYTQMVEVVKGDMDQAKSDGMIQFLKELGRDPVETRDISGYVSNGILMVYAVMALRLLERGARVEAVDQAAKELHLLPPFISFDSWKPSIVEDVTRVMCELRGDAFLRSSKLLAALAKDNAKFYVDQKPNPKIYDLAETRERTLEETTVKRALKTSILVAAARVAELGESPNVVDFVATEGVKIPRPPLNEIDASGAATVLEELSAVNQKIPGGPLPPPDILAAMVKDGETFYKHNQPNPWLMSRVER